ICGARVRAALGARTDDRLSARHDAATGDSTAADHGDSGRHGNSGRHGSSGGHGGPGPDDGAAARRDMNRAGAGAPAAAGLIAHASPALTSITPMRTALLPSLSGIGDPKHVALTFDDGPDTEYTPDVLARLDELGVRATFFMLGMMVAGNAELARDVVEAGHQNRLPGHEPPLPTPPGPPAPP